MDLESPPSGSPQNESPKPPALPPPPPLIASTATPARRASRGRGWMIAAIILFVLLLGSLLTQLGGVVEAVFATAPTLHQAAGPRMEEVLIKQAPTRNRILVVTIDGIIMGSTVDGIGYSLVDVVEAQLKRAAEDQHIKAVILKVDSPGGEVLASDEIYKAILRFQRESGKPVIASMGSVAASGGYYVSAPCQWIVANEMTITGSIGVIMSTFNYRGLMDKVGLRPEVFKSGKYKDMLRGSKQDAEITSEERKMIQDLVDETYRGFKAVVTEGREWAASKRGKPSGAEGRQLVSNWAEYADGRVFSGGEAYRLGFVDELGNFRTAVDRALKLAGVKEAALMEYRPVIDFLSLFRLFGKSEAGKVKVDFGLDLPRIQAGRLYFLCPSLAY
jgi:protease IV